jgi:hypothetical protein
MSQVYPSARIIGAQSTKSTLGLTPKPSPMQPKATTGGDGGRRKREFR